MTRKLFFKSSVVESGFSFFPLDSPDFNPIEKMWSKIESFLRKLEARSQRELSNATTQAFNLKIAVGNHRWTPINTDRCNNNGKPKKSGGFAGNRF